MDEQAERVVVGLPLTLRGEVGAQAEETSRFVERLRALPGRPGRDVRRTLHDTLAGPGDGEDARAAAHLLSSYLERSRSRN